MSDAKTAAFTAPYVSFKTLTNLAERMADEGTPQRIDRTYLSNLPGSTQSMLLSALNTFALIDGAQRPTDQMKALIDADAEQRPTLMGDLVRTHYGPALALGDNATQGQLEEVFTEQFNVSGSTRRKAIAFFLAATKYAGIPVSKHFKTPKAPAGEGGSTRRRTQRGTKGKDANDEETPLPPRVDDAAQAKARYIDLLLKKAEEEFDTDLLDRIEKVIGIGDPAPTAPKPSGPQSGRTSDEPEGGGSAD